jgi:peptidyl serine alpha-galactosyltransferase
MEHVAPGELPSPVDSLSDKDARASYVVGPPYVVTGRDMYQIAVKWSQFAPRVHDQYPHLLAEMFAYSLAAAHLKLPHQTAASFMVSDVTSGRSEGWSYVDDIPSDQICLDSANTEAYPNVLHFCQRYTWGPYFFGKYRFPHDFLSCETPLLAEPPADLLSKFSEGRYPGGDVAKMDGKLAKYNAFAICHMIRALNQAGAYYRQNHCDVGTANFNKTLVFTKIEDGGDYVLYSKK